MIKCIQDTKWTFFLALARVQGATSGVPEGFGMPSGICDYPSFEQQTLCHITNSFAAWEAEVQEPQAQSSLGYMEVIIGAFRSWLWNSV